MSGKSFRVYLVDHAQDKVSGTLLRKVDRLFDQPPPAAFGVSEAEVLARLEQTLVDLEAEEEDDDALERYLWEESFTARRVEVEVHPQNASAGGVVIGDGVIPLKVGYAYCELERGGFRVVLPRFGWWFVLESLALAPEVIRNGIYSHLLGEEAGSIYDFRHDGEERVLDWTPPFLARRAKSGSPDSPARPEPRVVATIAEELVAAADRKRLAPVVGIDPGFEALAPLLERDRPPSLLLCGGAGVGKSALVRRLARWLLDRRRGKLGSRRDSRLWSTSADRIVAGMVYLGMWQERCLAIADELAGEGDWLHVDRLADLLAPQSDGASIADLLAPFVIDGDLALIAECDEAELERCRRRHPALVDAMHLVRLDEMATSQLVALLPAYLARKGSAAEVHPDAWRRLVAHLGAFRRDVRFPGKAFAFLDWWLQQGERPAGVVYPRDMSSAFARYSGLPIELVSDEIPVGAAAIAAALGRGVIGQGEACATAARVLARFKAGINDPERPVGTLFFVGPTGVGKTELAKQMARYLFGAAERMVRLDMSEYMNPGAAQRLLEVGPGVTSLAEQVRQQPLCVVLLDEIEKAHPSVFDLLLGILGEGRLTDSLGRLVDFRMAVIVMTSNLGAREVRLSGFGAGAASDGASGGATADYLRSVMQHFRPEFFNRIDHVLSFRPLDPGDIERIVDLELDKVGQRSGLRDRALRLRLTPAARRLLAELGHDPKMGARPLRRVIEERLVAPLAVRMAAEPGFRDRVVEVATAAETAALPDGSRANAVSI